LGVDMIQETAKKEQFKRDAMPHLDAIWQTVNWLTDHEQDAEKMTEEIFNEAYTNWDDSINDSARKAWMFKVLIKVLLKSAPFDFRTPVADNMDDAYEPFPSDKIESLRSIPGDIISLAIRNLPVENRLTIILSVYQKFSYTEIANIIGVPKKAISQAIYQGYFKIQEELYNFIMSENERLPFAKCS
jgi:RNA polymerase sigma-70 factor (ECF subfamily)